MRRSPNPKEKKELMGQKNKFPKFDLLSDLY
jgi:hypothetical protein